MNLVKFNSLGNMKRLNFINVFLRVFHLSQKFNYSFLVIGLFLASCNSNTLKTGYIDINQVNKEYKVAIKFEKHLKSIEKHKKEEYKKVSSSYQAAYDSITIIKQSNNEPSQELISHYLSCKKNYELIKQEGVSSIQDSIVFYKDRLNKKINHLVFEYAQKEGYDYVFSPAGSGTFMYGDSSLNITNQVIAYLNSN